MTAISALKAHQTRQEALCSRRDLKVLATRGFTKGCSWCNKKGNEQITSVKETEAGRGAYAKREAQIETQDCVL
jgi:hypothetical protein